MVDTQKLKKRDLYLNKIIANHRLSRHRTRQGADRHPALRQVQPAETDGVIHKGTAKLRFGGAFVHIFPRFYEGLPEYGHDQRSLSRI